MLLYILSLLSGSQFPVSCLIMAPCKPQVIATDAVSSSKGFGSGTSAGAFCRAQGRLDRMVVEGLGFEH